MNQNWCNISFYHQCSQLKHCRVWYYRISVYTRIHPYTFASFGQVLPICYRVLPICYRVFANSLPIVADSVADISSICCRMLPNFAEVVSKWMRGYLETPRRKFENNWLTRYNLYWLGISLGIARCTSSCPEYWLESMFGNWQYWTCSKISRVTRK